MGFAGLSQDEMRAALSHLEQAMFHHDQWFEGINRTLICEIAPDQRDTVDDAHAIAGSASGCMAVPRKA